MPFEAKCPARAQKASFSSATVPATPMHEKPGEKARRRKAEISAVAAGRGQLYGIFGRNPGIRLEQVFKFCLHLVEF